MRIIQARDDAPADGVDHAGGLADERGDIRVPADDREAAVTDRTADAAGRVLSPV